MSLRINRVNKESEYLSISVLSDCNLSSFAILDKTFSKDGNISNIHKHIYRFPNKEVIKGQVIFLYTKKGKYHFKDDNPLVPKGIHVFYMNLDVPIWNNDETDCATLWKIEDSEDKKAE